MIACVVCKDERGFALSQRLRTAFAEVYWVSSDTDYRKFCVVDEVDGLSIPRRSLPTKFQAVFFHSGNDVLWQSQGLKADVTFEFNTPGMPAARAGVVPIFRATGAYLGIGREDIDQVAGYLAGQRPNLPAMCYPPMEALPALAVLCEAYLSGYGENPKLSQPSWWLAGLGGLKQGKPDWERMDQLQAAIAQECRSSMGPPEIAQIQALVRAIVELTFASIAPDLVESAYGAIAQFASLPLAPATTESWELEGKQILTLPGNFATQAIAQVVAQQFKLPVKQLDLSHYPVKLPKSLNRSVLVLTEAQLPELSRLRSQRHNFRGAVLVVSSQSFKVLKQKYRILTCGQGSHQAFTLPWGLAQLQQHLAQLRPLQPENLELWQRESQEFEQVNRAKIADCQARIKQLKPLVQGGLAPLAQPLPVATVATIDAIEATVGDLRVNAKFACHTTVPLFQGEKRPRPIKDHFEQALQDVRQPGQANQAIRRLEQTLDYLSQLLLTCVEPTAGNY